MIQFNSLTIENFFSIAESSIGLDKKGAILVTGEVRGKASAFTSNGAGKTSIFNALVWGLFGKTIRPLPSDEDVIRTGAEGTAVTIRLTVDDKPYTITRTRKRGKPSKLRVTDEHGDDTIVGGSVVQMSRFLEERLLHCDFDSFCNTVYFPQGSFTFFTQANDVERKKIFDRLLGTLEFVDWEKRAKALKVTHETALAHLVSVKQINQSLLNRETMELGQIPAEEKELSRRLQSERASLGGAVVTPEAAQVNLTKARKGVTEAKKRLEAGTEEATKRAALEARLNELKAQQSIARDTHNRVCKRLTAQRELIAAGNCPTCLQPITDQGKAAVKELTEDVNRQKAELATIEAKIADIVLPDRVRLGDMKDDLRQAEAKVRILEEDLEEIKAQVTDYEKAKAVIEARYEEGTAHLDARREALEERIESLKELIAHGETEITETDAKLKQAIFWINGFGPRGIRSLIFENIMPYLNERANHYSSILTDGTIQISVMATSKTKAGDERERISVSAVNADGSQVYEGNSGGERKRVDLCILLALQDIILNRSQASIRLSVYDELLDELDEEGIERVVELLKDRGQTQPVFLISHNTALKGFFEDTVSVVKMDGVSKIEIS